MQCQPAFVGPHFSVDVNRKRELQVGAELIPAGIKNDPYGIGMPAGILYQLS